MSRKKKDLLRYIYATFTSKKVEGDIMLDLRMVEQIVDYPHSTKIPKHIAKMIYKAKTLEDLRPIYDALDDARDEYEKDLREYWSQDA